MSKRWISALVKWFVAWIIIHVIAFILSCFVTTNVGILGYPVLWAHWNTWTRAIIAIAGAAILYFIIYKFFTSSRRAEN